MQFVIPEIAIDVEPITKLCYSEDIHNGGPDSRRLEYACVGMATEIYNPERTVKNIYD